MDRILCALDCCFMRRIPYTMHRRYLQTRNMDANNMDASPLLGVCGIDALASESDVSTVARTTQNRTEKPAGAAPEYVSVRVRLMTTDMPAPPLANNPVLGNNAQRCSSTTVVSSSKRPDTRRSHASAMSMQTFSPLVRTPSRRRASMSVSTDTREISLTVRSSHTIEELATRIEGLANDGEESGDCMALFKGGRPLQFASRVADVLEGRGCGYCVQDWRHP
ncbi:hypothetical protein DL89DRAFT_113873 [Linderina pennispora]|uniref:Ubiquitin-like domain-containing protein n=1 Tax=Linderina pennispora TaxID=61395 RepID=A0A1Y1WHB5_9FUNG|nr:uncharacterized protein DL89DRAFT_113873 [Linderina pennispora]ORX72514.1 hypothetical protein DL89DRAFT_113873 [Linderina pennispora]